MKRRGERGWGGEDLLAARGRASRLNLGPWFDALLTHGDRGHLPAWGPARPHTPREHLLWEEGEKDARANLKITTKENKALV